MTIYALDLSLSCTGVATLGKLSRIKSEATPKANLAERGARLNSMRDRVTHAVRGAEVVIIEGPALNGEGIKFDLWGLWWLVVAALQDEGIRVVEVASTSIKIYATGRGSFPKVDGKKADGKKIVLDAVRETYPAYSPADHNEAEALALLALALDRLGQPLATLPATHRRALKGVQWPASFEIKKGPEPQC